MGGGYSGTTCDIRCARHLRSTCPSDRGCAASTGHIRGTCSSDLCGTCSCDICSTCSSQSNFQHHCGTNNSGCSSGSSCSSNRSACGQPGCREEGLLLDGLKYKFLL